MLDTKSTQKEPILRPQTFNKFLEKLSDNYEVTNTITVNNQDFTAGSPWDLRNF